MLRKRTLLFVSLVLGSLLVLPVLNIAARLESGRAPSWTASALFGTDLELASPLRQLLYRTGISTSPAQVLIGRGGWLYLGDEYERTVTVTRRGQTPADAKQAATIAHAAQAWDLWMQQRGVKLYRVLVGPNKSSIHPEHLPEWARPAETRATDGLFAHGPWYVDPAPALLQARSEGQELLYFRHDTHWTQLGAGVAFQALASSVGPHAPDLKWPEARMFRTAEVRVRQGGDLAHFLHLGGALTEQEPTIVLATAVDTVRYDHADGRVLKKGGNAPLESPSRPIRVVSAGALNARKILWLRDSFGTSLSPMMAATFTETVQVHWNAALSSPKVLANLIDKWRPDYVFVTVVERDALHGLFAVPPSDSPLAPVAHTPAKH